MPYKIIEIVNSPMHGPIKVVQDDDGIQIITKGITQSGYLIENIWKKALFIVKNYWSFRISADQEVSAAFVDIYFEL